MIRTVLLTILTLSIAFGGGIWSVWHVLGTVDGLGALRLGSWVAFPLAGTPDADPYTKARIAREAELPLGAAEGLTFLARFDSADQPLRRECRYRIEGQTPASRFWTLHAADSSLNALGGQTWQPVTLHSREVVRDSDGSLSIETGPDARPGNWLAYSGNGPLVFMLALYDTPIASSSSITAVELPQILRTGCDG